MAREILFRGKRTDNGKWVEGHLIVFPKSKITKIMVWNAADLDFDAIEVRPESVGQYTGLTDKDGKKIFEGDIVNCYTFTGMNDYRRGVVHWNEMFCGWYGKESCSLLCGLGEIYEVIGNIHDNSELLNGTES